MATMVVVDYVLFTFLLILYVPQYIVQIDVHKTLTLITLVGCQYKTMAEQCALRRMA